MPSRMAGGLTWSIPFMHNQYALRQPWDRDHSPIAIEHCCWLASTHDCMYQQGEDRSCLCESSGLNTIQSVADRVACSECLQCGMPCNV